MRPLEVGRQLLNIFGSAFLRFCVSRLHQTTSNHFKLNRNVNNLQWARMKRGLYF